MSTAAQAVNGPQYDGGSELIPMLWKNENIAKRNCSTGGVSKEYLQNRFLERARGPAGGSARCPVPVFRFFF